MRTLYPIFFILTIFSCMIIGKENVHVSASQTGNNHTVSVSTRIQTVLGLREVNLYRSYYDLNSLEHLNLLKYPITKMRLQPTTMDIVTIDSMVADNCDYFYYVIAKTNTGEMLPCNVAHVKTRNVPLSAPIREKPGILIDKKNYFLEIAVGGKPMKRYPVSLGQDPMSRKIQQDCLTTPEGFYAISYFKPQSQFHKAIGVNYPTRVDLTRYATAKKRGMLELVDGELPSVGGAVQIHGGGIGNNWTWGCIAMRNSDIDELFQSHSLTIGTPLWIVGFDFTRDSLNKGKKGMN